MTVAKKPPTAAETQPTFPFQLEDQIRNRAYELYVARGKEDGRAADDWLKAEAEVRCKRKARGAAA